MSVNIDASQLSAAVMAELSKFQGATNEVIDHAAITAANHAVMTLNISSPSLSGDYKRGWAVKIKKKAKVGGTASVVVHNRTSYRLTHLLEHGHAKYVYGRRLPGDVSARPHIQAVEKETIAEFEELVRIGVSKV